MAHELFFDNNLQRHAFFSAKIKPWHGYGLLTDDSLTVEEALRESGADFEVQKIPNQIILPNGDIVASGSFSTIRNDNHTILGNRLTEDYHVIQNREAFHFLNSIVEGNEAIFETAGVLFEGKRVFAVIKVPGYIRVGGDDICEKYVVVMLGHDGTMSLICGITPIRVVCNNTLTAALSNMSNKIKIRHSKNAQVKLDQAKDLLDVTNLYCQEMETIFNRMSKTTLLDKDLKRLIVTTMANEANLEKLAKSEEVSKQFTNTVDKIFEYAMSAPSQQLDTTRGTVYGYFNAITGFYQNCFDYETSDAKMASLYCGGSAEKNTQKALNIALSLI